jgi:hypothetical protein
MEGSGWKPGFNGAAIDDMAESPHPCRDAGTCQIRLGARPFPPRLVVGETAVAIETESKIHWALVLLF